MRTLYLCGVQTRSSEGNLQGNCVQKKKTKKKHTGVPVCDKYDGIWYNI